MSQIEMHRYPSGTGEAVYREKGSRFLAFVFPVSTEEQVKEHIQRLRQEHPQAVHVCSGYLLDVHKGQGRAHDDGEPSGSAGRPILNKIYSHDISNVLVAVVRYYGGIKLGVPGLIHAYKTAADEALTLAGVVEKEAEFSLQMRFAFEKEGECTSWVKRFRGQWLQRTYTHEVNWLVSFPRSVQAEVLASPLFGVEISGPL